MPDLFGDERRAIERKREADDSFGLFWAAYPRKQARIDAVKAWHQLRPNAETVQAILDALEWQRETWDNPTFIPLPASWIRGERWTDEPPATADKTMSKASAAVLRLMK
jgi:hypothetical protein